MKPVLVRRSVPVDLIFSQANIVEKNNPHYDELAVWQDVPLINLDPHMAALDHCLGHQGNFERYVEFERKRRLGEHIKARELEQKLRHETSLLPRMFHRELAIIERMERDRLVLQKGNLVCCLAKIRQEQWIEALMPEPVAAQWEARSTAALDAIVAKQGRKSFYTPIMHEKYRKWPISRMGTKRLDLIRRFLGPIHRRLTILDIGCNTGFYTFHFYRQGFDVAGIDVDESHLAIAQAQCSMYAADIKFERVALQDFNPGRKFDIVLGLSVFWHILGWGAISAAMTPTQLGAKLDEFVEHALFWEGGKRAKEEIEIIKRNSGLVHYTSLGRTSATGIENREFGVFTRRPANEIAREFSRSDLLNEDGSTL